MIFDLLWLDGHSLIDLPYIERRERLLELGLQGDRWQTPAHHVGDGAAMLEASRAQGLEGIIAKRLDCPYHPGKRAHGWVKVKNVLETDVVVGGWLPGEGRRAAQFGALVVGVHKDGELRYAGRVGTGFDERELNRLGGMLAEPRARRRARSRAASRRARRASSSRCSSPASGMGSGRRPARCATRATSACATTSTPRPWSSTRRETDRRHRRLPDRPRRDADVALAAARPRSARSAPSTPRSTPA